jgi:nitrite reductase/ring-hydroxylating ferredoxin subunit
VSERDAKPTTRYPDGRPEPEQPPWRHDFPIDWPEDHYVARRDYTKFLVLTSLAFVVGQLWIGLQSLLRRGRGRPLARPIARLDDIPVGGAIAFQYPGKDDPCLLLRTADDRLLAYGQKCTHLSCAVVPRLERGELHCPCHVGSFDAATGRPIAGPPRRALPRIVVEVREGTIYATGVAEGTA